MSVTYGFFDSVNGDRKYNAAQMSDYFKGIVTEGVFQHLDGGLAVTAGTGLAVNVGAGRAIIQNRWVQNSAAMSLTIAAASETYARKDAVVIRLNWSSRAISIAVKTGTPAASPVAPSMTRNSTTYEMALAYVNVAANATSVTITDKRSDSTVCGWVTVAQATSGEVDAQLNAMKTGFDGVTYASPAAQVIGSDTKLQDEIGMQTYKLKPNGGLSALIIDIEKAVAVGDTYNIYVQNPTAGTVVGCRLYGYNGSWSSVLKYFPIETDLNYTFSTTYSKFRVYIQISGISATDYAIAQITKIDNYSVGGQLQEVREEVNEEYTKVTLAPNNDHSALFADVSISVNRGDLIRFKFGTPVVGTMAYNILYGYDTDWNAIQSNISHDEMVVMSDADYSQLRMRTNVTNSSSSDSEICYVSVIRNTMRDQLDSVEYNLDSLSKYRAIPARLNGSFAQIDIIKDFKEGQPFTFALLDYAYGDLTSYIVYLFKSDHTYVNAGTFTDKNMHTIWLTENYAKIRLYVNFENTTDASKLYADFYASNVNTISGAIQKNAIDSGNKLTSKIFKKVVCCGDSYTSGYIVDPDNNTDNMNENYAWPHYMATLTGNTWVNCGASGRNAYTWQIHQRGLPKAQASGKTQAYIVALMINDSSSDPDRNLPIGTSADIGTDQITYYAQYSKVIRELAAISPDAFIFICTCPNTDARYIPYNQAIHDIYTAYSGTYHLHVLDLYLMRMIYQCNTLTGDARGGHYTAIGYEQFSELMNYVLTSYINSHITTFQNVAFLEYESEPKKEGIDALLTANASSCIDIDFTNTYITGKGRYVELDGVVYFSVFHKLLHNISSGYTGVYSSLPAPSGDVTFWEYDLGMENFDQYMSHVEDGWRLNGKHTTGEYRIVFGKYTKAT